MTGLTHRFGPLTVFRGLACKRWLSDMAHVYCLSWHYSLQGFALT
jgi:hypothetical protein